MRASAQSSISVSEALEVLIEAIADRVASKLSGRPRWYSSSALPVGCPTGRALRDRCRKLGIPMTKAGRDMLVDAAAYDAALSSHAKQLAPPGVTATDEELLAKMGVVLTRAGGGR